MDIDSAFIPLGKKPLNNPKKDYLKSIHSGQCWDLHSLASSFSCHPSAWPADKGLSTEGEVCPIKISKLLGKAKLCKSSSLCFLAHTNNSAGSLWGLKHDTPYFSRDLDRLAGGGIPYGRRNASLTISKLPWCFSCFLHSPGAFIWREIICHWDVCGESSKIKPLFLQRPFPFHPVHRTNLTQTQENHYAKPVPRTGKVLSHPN